MATVETIKPLDATMDEFGRTVDERTVELLPKYAEFVNTLVDDGTCDTYAEAVNYLCERGEKEIERQRESGKKQAEQRKTAQSLQKFNEMLSKSPKLVENPVALVATAKAIGAWSPAIEAMLKSMGVRFN